VRVCVREFGGKPKTTQKPSSLLIPPSTCAASNESTLSSNSMVSPTSTATINTKLLLADGASVAGGQKVATSARAEATTNGNGHISTTAGAMDKLKAPLEAQDKGLFAAVRRDSLHCTAPEQNSEANNHK